MVPEKRMKPSNGEAFAVVAAVCHSLPRQLQNMLRIWLLRVLVFASLWMALLGAFGGDYTVTIEKIDNQPELSREYVDWHVSIKRINKKDKVLEGYYRVKKDIVGPKALLTAYILSNNKYYRMAMNELVPTDLCDPGIKKNFIDPYLVGNSSFSVPPDCTIRPGYMKLHTDNFDVVAHKVMNKTIYGTYKLVTRIINRNNKTVGGASWVITAKKR